MGVNGLNLFKVGLIFRCRAGYPGLILVGQPLGQKPRLSQTILNEPWTLSPKRLS